MTSTQKADWFSHSCSMFGMAQEAFNRQLQQHQSLADVQAPEALKPLQPLDGQVHHDCHGALIDRCKGRISPYKCQCQVRQSQLCTHTHGHASCQICGHPLQAAPWDAPVWFQWRLSVDPAGAWCASAGCQRTHLRPPAGARTARWAVHVCVPRSSHAIHAGCLSWPLKDNAASTCRETEYSAAHVERALSSVDVIQLGTRRAGGSSLGQLVSCRQLKPCAQGHSSRLGRQAGTLGSQLLGRQQALPSDRAGCTFWSGRASLPMAGRLL